MHDNIKYYLANIKVYPNVSILRAKEDRNRRNILAYEAIAYFLLDFEQGGGNFVSNLISGKKHAMNFATHWSK